MSAEDVRNYVNREYIEPARQGGEKRVTIRAGDVHDKMNLSNRQPLVCDTLSGRKLQELCRVKLIEERWGRNVHQRHAKNIWYTYELLDPN